MLELTQSSKSPGNCWQTAIACILDQAIDSLPPQELIEAWPMEVMAGWGSYQNVLNGYLRTHHNLCYSTIHKGAFTAVLPIRKHHVITGPTCRTPESGSHHCVVGVRGKEVWDPHPSRAGLTEHVAWGVIGRCNTPAPTPSSTLPEATRHAHALVFGCLCQQHNLAAALTIADQHSSR